MNSDKSLGKHVFVFNPKENGGEALSLSTEYFWNEALSLSTEYFWNGDGKKDVGVKQEPYYGIYTNQELSLQSYCNDASFGLYGTQITPEILRQLANELDQARISAMQKRNKLENAKKND